MPKYMYGFSSKDGAKRRRIQSRSEDSDFDPDPYFLRGLRIYILPAGLGNSRRRVLQNLVKKHGGIVVHSVSDSTTHVLVYETISSANVCRSLGWTIFPPHIKVVMVGWLSASIRASSCIDTSEYEIPFVIKPNVKESASSHRKNANVRTDPSAENGFHPHGSLSENPDVGEFTNEEVREEESTFDDGVYDDETSCDDEWLLDTVPEPLMFGLINSFRKGTSITDPIQTDSSSRNYRNIFKFKSVKHFGDPNRKSAIFSNNNSAGKLKRGSGFKTNSESANRLSRGFEDLERSSVSERRLKLSQYRPFKSNKSVRIYSKKNQNSSFHKTDFLRFNACGAPQTVTSTGLRLMKMQLVNHDLSIPACIRQEISQLYGPKSDIPRCSISVTHPTDSLKQLPISHSKVQQNISTPITESMKPVSVTLSPSMQKAPFIQDIPFETVTPESQPSITTFQACSDVKTSSPKLNSVEENLKKSEIVICETSNPLLHECGLSKEELLKNNLIEQKEESEINTNLPHSTKSESTAICPVSESSINISNSESVSDILNTMCINLSSNCESDKKSSKDFIEVISKSDSLAETSSIETTADFSLRLNPQTSSLISNVNYVNYGASTSKTNYVNYGASTSKTNYVNYGASTSKTNYVDYGASTSKTNTESVPVVFDLVRGIIDELSFSSTSLSQDDQKFKPDAHKVELKDFKTNVSMDILNAGMDSDEFEVILDVMNQINAFAEFNSTTMKPLLSKNTHSECDESSRSIEMKSGQVGQSKSKCLESENMPAVSFSDASMLKLNAPDVCYKSHEKSLHPSSNTDLQCPNNERFDTSPQPSKYIDKKFGSAECVGFSELKNDDADAALLSSSNNDLSSHIESSLSYKYAPCISGQQNSDNQNQSKSVAKSEIGGTITSEASVSQQTFCSVAPQRSCSKERYKSSYCFQSSNNFIVNKLQKMYEYFKRTGDKWRVHAYEKAIIALRTCPKPITAYEEAVPIDGMSKTIARKIIHWIKTGDYSEVDIMCSKEKALVVKIFNRAWGIGSKLAAELYEQGHRTIVDLRTNSDLSREHLVGLRYFDDLKTRMPREEAQSILSTVLSRIFEIFPYVQCDACSSLRRNQKFCGHVNVLVTLPEDMKNNHKILPEIVARLHQEGFLIDDLKRHEENGNQTHYSGIFKLKAPGAQHRRVDITVCSKDEYACALLYLTGSAYFNRAIRQVALKKNMILNEHSLRIKSHLGSSICHSSSVEPTMAEEIVYTPSEAVIFTHLDLPYRSPEQRDRSFF